MNLIDTFKIKNKDIITIVGAGGKTSLMFSASSFLRKNYKVLVTTTTHIYVPDEKLYDKMIMISNKEKFDYIFRNNKKGIYLVGNNIINNSRTNKSNTSNYKVNDLKTSYPKIKGLTFEQLDKIISYFDLVIIEGDGSKEKPLKGWNDTEPVIYPKTTKTIGVVDITSIGLDINEDNIHRVDRFLKIINDDWDNKDHYLFKNVKCNSANKVNTNHLKNMILNKKGLFKASKGERILFINKAENINNKENSLELIKNIKKENPLYIDDFIYGSIFNNEFIKE